jgi:hypothetical protein
MKRRKRMEFTVPVFNAHRMYGGGFEERLF